MESTNQALQTFNGNRIVISSGYQRDVILSEMGKGIYGFDTESDCQTRELRLIQIFDGQTAYIFPATDLHSSEFQRFLRAEDRIKVGVAIEGDVDKIQSFYHEIMRIRPACHGFVDIKNIAVSLGYLKPGLSALSEKFIPGFVKYKSMLGRYINPSREQYIYAANDAQCSYMVYKALVGNMPTPDVGDIKSRVRDILIESQSPLSMLDLHKLLSDQNLTNRLKQALSSIRIEAPGSGYALKYDMDEQGFTLKRKTINDPFVNPGIWKNKAAKWPTRVSKSKLVYSLDSSPEQKRVETYKDVSSRKKLTIPKTRKPIRYSPDKIRQIGASFDYSNCDNCEDTNVTMSQTIYVNMLICLVKCCSNEPFPKKLSKFVAQLMNSYSFSDVFCPRGKKKDRVNTFLSVAISKGDLVKTPRGFILADEHRSR